jgi:hypothetical protein
MIHPDSKLKSYWDIFIILLAVENAVLTPYELAYGAFESIVKEIFDWSLNVIFFTDIIITFRT